MDRTRPDLDDATVEALGKLSEALEAVEHARGLLYGFHRLTGTADLALQEAVDLFRTAGHTALADDLDKELVGRNVIADRWTFQIVEDFDGSYWSAFREFDEGARKELAGGGAARVAAGGAAGPLGGGGKVAPRPEGPSPTTRRAPPPRSKRPPVAPSTRPDGAPS